MIEYEFRELNLSGDPVLEEAARLTSMAVWGEMELAEDYVQKYLSVVNGSVVRALTTRPAYEEVLVGISSARVGEGNGVAYLDTFAIGENFRQRNLGSLLLRCTEVDLMRQGATLIRGSTLPSAKGFYTKNGYRFIHKDSPLEIAKLLPGDM